jgi:hypothetical protein
MCFLLFCLPVTSVDTKLILPVLYGCESWSLTLREEHRLRVFEKRMLRRIFGPKKKWQEAGEDCIMWSFITCVLHQILG